MTNKNGGIAGKSFILRLEMDMNRVKFGEVATTSTAPPSSCTPGC